MFIKNNLYLRIFYEKIFDRNFEFFEIFYIL